MLAGALQREVPIDVFIAALLLGLLLIVGGYATSVTALRRPATREVDIIGHAMFLGGGMIAATGFVLIVTHIP